MLNFLRAALAGGLLLLPAAAWAQRSPIDIPTTNRAVVITTGATFQTVLAAVGAPGFSFPRQSLTIQNNNTNSDNCWVFIGSGMASTAKSILLGPGGSYQRYYPFVPSDVIQATCTTTNDTLYIDTQ